MCLSVLKGDSGGPLSQTINGFVSYHITNQYIFNEFKYRREYQLGIVSFGNGCGKADYPGIYTNIALYNDWIQDTIQAN